MSRIRRIGWVALLTLAVIPAACDQGLAPPDQVIPGSIRGIVRYTGTWPASAQIHDLRFVAMRFVPRDTSDFLQLNLMAISDRLEYGVRADTFFVGGVEPGVFVYAGVAQQYTTNVLSWKPIGLFETDGGIFDVRAGQTTEIELEVDFARPPVFPPP